MQDKIGESFAGVISAVTGFGFFVELSDLYVEGLVHVTSLGQDFFKFDPTSHQLKGERTGVSYRLGDSVNVTVISVNLDDKKIDFDLVGMPSRGASMPVENSSKKSAKHDDKKKSKYKKRRSKSKPGKKGV